MRSVVMRLDLGFSRVGLLSLDKLRVVDVAVPVLVV